MPLQIKRRLFLLLPVIAGIMWGSVGVFVRMLSSQGLSNGTIVFTRMLISALFLAFFILVTNIEHFKLPLRLMPILIIGGVIGSAYMNVVFNVAVQELQLSLASVLLGLFALWAIFLGRLFFKEPVTIRKLICVAIAIFGVILVSGAIEQSDMAHLSLFAIFMGLLSGIMYAISGVANRYLTEKGLAASTINFWYFLFGALSLIPMLDSQQLFIYINQNPFDSTIWLVSQALICGLFPYVLFTLSLKHLDLGIASTLELVEPVAAMFFGFAIFHEVPSVLNIIGMILVVSAISVTFFTPRNSVDTC